MTNSKNNPWFGFLVAAVVGLGCLAVAPEASAQAVAPVSDIEIDGDYGPFLYRLPTIASEHGHRVDQLINWVHIFMAVLFVGWGAFFVYCLVKFRARPGHEANPKLVKAKVSKYVAKNSGAFNGALVIRP